jgi:heat shock protein HslJ
MPPKRTLIPAIGVLAALALTGCSGAQECSSGSVYTEGPNKGQCASKQAAEASEAQQHHDQEVSKEAGEAEAVIKHRQAEETANEVEHAAGG